MEKSWMWADDASGGVMGAVVDLEDGEIMWFDQPGCGCGGPDNVQTIADFMANGARFVSPPDDILQEMQTLFAGVLSG